MKNVKVLECKNCGNKVKVEKESDGVIKCCDIDMKVHVEKEDNAVHSDKQKPNKIFINYN